MSERYPWLTVEPDGRMTGDMQGTSPAEMDRRLIIMQELKAGRLVLAADHRRAVEALGWVADRYAKTLAGKSVRDADEALERARLIVEGR